jgi:hypothetical protein
MIDPFLSLLLAPPSSASVPAKPTSYPPELTTNDWLRLLFPPVHSPAKSDYPADAGVVYGGDHEEVF